MSDLGDKKHIERLLAYNHALFDSMASFVDAVWWVNIKEETARVMCDRMVSEFNGKIFSLSDLREIIRANSPSVSKQDEARFFEVEFLQSLRETFTYESAFHKDGRVHVILCSMTPGFDESGSVAEVFISMKDIQSQLDKDEEHKLALSQIEMLNAIQNRFDAVLEIDIKNGMIRILSDDHNYYKPYCGKVGSINKTFGAIRYSVCSHSRKAFEEVTSMEKIREKLREQSSVTVELESITTGWVRVTIIPSAVGPDGEVEKCLQLIENIENTKKQERKTRKELDDTMLQERKEREILKAFGDIYENVHIFDLARHSIEEICAMPVVHEYMLAHRSEGVQNIIWGVMAQRICENHCEDILQFTRLSDLGLRMKGKVIISVEAIDADDKWFRFSFIRIGNKDEKLTKVILVSQDIDEEKRRVESFRVMSHTDELTGLYNRHAYEEITKRYEEEGIGDDLWYVSLDINGLKATNDSQGHSAGDELISGIADCLRSVFSDKGRIFRMGGDEFIVTIRATQEEMDDMAARLDEVGLIWKGQLMDGFSFSKGIVCSADIPNCTIALLEQESDRRMYIEKKEYHSEYDRRLS